VEAQYRRAAPLRRMAGSSVQLFVAVVTMIEAIQVPLKPIYVTRGVGLGAGFPHRVAASWAKPAQKQAQHTHTGMNRMSILFIHTPKRDRNSLKAKIIIFIHYHLICMCHCCVNKHIWAFPSLILLYRGIPKSCLHIRAPVYQLRWKCLAKLRGT
jgi:hypothetical protein